ncbi:hypothetical protein Tco_0355044 [Tanacetum coccineum]
MIDELSIVETDKVINTVETDKVKQIIDVESSGKSADEIGKETVSFGEMQLKQEDGEVAFLCFIETSILLLFMLFQFGMNGKSI